MVLIDDPFFDVQNMEKIIFVNCSKFANPTSLRIEHHLHKLKSGRQGIFLRVVPAIHGILVQSNVFPIAEHAYTDLLHKSLAVRRHLQQQQQQQQQQHGSPHDAATIANGADHNNNTEEEGNSGSESDDDVSVITSISSYSSDDGSEFQEHRDEQDKNEAIIVNDRQKGGNKQVGNATTGAPMYFDLNAQGPAGGRPRGPRAQGPAQGPNNNNGAHGTGHGPQPKQARPLPPPPGPRAHYPKSPAQGQGSPPRRREPPSNQKATSESNSDKNNNTVLRGNKNPPSTFTLDDEDVKFIGKYRLNFTGLDRTPSKLFHSPAQEFYGPVTPEALQERMLAYIKACPEPFDEWIDLKAGGVTGSVRLFTVPVVRRGQEGSGKYMTTPLDPNLLDFDDQCCIWLHEWEGAEGKGPFVPNFEMFVRHEKPKA